MIYGFKMKLHIHFFLTCWPGKHTKVNSGSWISRLNRYLHFQTRAAVTVMKHKKRRKWPRWITFEVDFAMPKSAWNPMNYISNCGKFIQIFEFGGTFTIWSMRSPRYLVFLWPVLSRPVTLSNIYIKPTLENTKMPSLNLNKISPAF